MEPLKNLLCLPFISTEVNMHLAFQGTFKYVRKKEIYGYLITCRLLHLQDYGQQDLGLRRMRSCCCPIW